METLKNIQERNTNFQILPVTDHSFSKYGQIHYGIQTDSLVKNTLNYVKMSEKVVIYEASIPELEKDKDLMQDISSNVYGEMPIQIGLCYGWNTKLNGLEYHKGSEFIVAVTDIILLLGNHRDIKFGENITYDTSLVEAFFVEAGSTVELYASALHFAPVHVNEESGFIAVIVLPKGTNEPIQNPVEKVRENRLLMLINKWLIMHPEAATEEYVGLIGANTEINPL